VKPEHLREVLEKFAVSGAMYARALGGAAQRANTRIAPQILSRLQAQPRAQASPFLSQQARMPGALAPTTEQAKAQTIMRMTPWAGAEHGGDPNAASIFQRLLGATGRVQAQPGLRQSILRAFGPNPYDRLMPDVKSQSTRAFAPTMLAPSPFDRTVSAAPPMERTTAATPQALRKQADFGDIARKAAPWVLGLGIPLATTGGLLLSKPGIRASLREKIDRPESTQEKDLRAAVPEGMMSIAQRAQQAMIEHGYDPATLRIAVDAPPGAGKSTLSHALVNQMGVKHYGLDWLPPEQQELSGGHLEKMPRAPRAGEVLEHHNLLRTHDPELFDAALYIAKHPDEIRQQILRRGRSAGMAEFYDYPKTIGVGHLAFDTLAGDPISLGDGVFMKLRPREGWGTEQIDVMLASKGIDPAGLTRHEKLLSLYGGKRTTGHGWLPYAKSPLSSGETAVAAGSIPLGIGAALAASKFLR
jgi:hypothetical protein